METYCTVTKTKYVKKEGTKTAWKEVESKTEPIDRTHYDNIVGAKSFMQRLGGSEHHTKSYTSAGYVVTQIISTSPDKENKSVYQFKFD